MTRETYTCRRYKSVGTFEYEADFVEAASNITVRFDGHDDWQSTPFQVADAKHDRRRAERMIAEYFR
jgi:hypothetical protein